MKFSKPINREVEIDGNTFVVSFDDNGIDFRVKGKRKTAHVDWIGVLNIAQGEQGENGREFLGITPGQSQQQEASGAERIGQIFAPQVAATSPSQSEAGIARANQAAESNADDSTKDELGRAVSAGEVGPES